MAERLASGLRQPSCREADADPSAAVAIDGHFAQLRGHGATIEVACFLRLTLLRLMDGNLTFLDHQISALWRGARERMEASQAGRLRRLRRLLGDLASLAEDQTLDADEMRKQLKRLISPFEPERRGSQVAAIRQELGRKSQDLARLLKIAREAPLAVPTDRKLAAAFATLDALSGSPNALPDKAAQPFGPSWQALIDQPDRAAALGCFCAATLMGLKRALRRGMNVGTGNVSTDPTEVSGGPEMRDHRSGLVR
jgi:hypothetical protein